MIKVKKVKSFAKKIITPLFSSFRKDVVFALVGESGTGKSYNAKLVAERYGLRAIIDDGLLIQGDKILAGQSAKSEKTYMGAVRIALFDNKEYRDSVVRAIKKHHIHRILILGTSEKMVLKIATRLQLTPPQQIIKIEDISTKEQIELAIKSRNIEGKHIIPVASLEVKHQYPKIFFNGIRFTFHRLGPLKSIVKENRVIEKSVVQPIFSKRKRSHISQALIAKLTVKSVTEFDRHIRIKKMIVKPCTQGYTLVLTIDIPQEPKKGLPLTKRIDLLQRKIIEEIENSTGNFIQHVNVILDKIIPEKKLKNAS